MAPWRRVVGSAIGAVDRAALALAVGGAKPRGVSGSSLEIEHFLAIEAAYAGSLDASVHFPEPPETALSLCEVTRRDAKHFEVWDASWPSAFRPHLAEIGSMYCAHVANRTARARLFLGAEKSPQRPAVIAIHGYRSGAFVLGETEWPVAWLVQRGVDVALAVLPFHGLRGGRHRGEPLFPHPDPRFTIEAFRQAVCDVRVLARWLRARGATHVGLLGMSLGGYTAALVATTSRDVDFVMPFTPLASIADFVRERDSFACTPQTMAWHEALDRALFAVSPLARPLCLPASRALVVGAEHDRITPMAHATRLATHFGCDLLTIPGGHLLQLGRERAFRALESMLEQQGILRAPMNRHRK
jgi:pimeloyl-ACP methyl ester carboxylesterase